VKSRSKTKGKRQHIILIRELLTHGGGNFTGSAREKVMKGENSNPFEKCTGCDKSWERTVSKTRGSLSGQIQAPSGKEKNPKRKKVSVDLVSEQPGPTKEKHKNVGKRSAPRTKEWGRE